MKIEIVDVILITGEKKNRGKWGIRIVEKLYEVKDDVTRSVRLTTPTSHIERPIQYLYPPKLHCNMEKSTSKPKNTSLGKRSIDGNE